jgi:hypothetical protein
MREEKSVVSKSIKHRHGDADDGSVVTLSSYSTSYTAMSRKTVQNMKLSSSASALNNRIHSDNIILDNVLEGISAMTNFLEGTEQKRTTLDDLAKSRINLEDCMKLKEQIREKIRNSKREKRKDLFTAAAETTLSHDQHVGDDMSLITTESSVQFSYMRKTRSPRRSRSPDNGTSLSYGLFLTDDDRDLQDVAFPLHSKQKLPHLDKAAAAAEKKMIRQRSADSIASEDKTFGSSAVKASKQTGAKRKPPASLVPLKPAAPPVTTVTVKPIAPTSSLLRPTASISRQQCLTHPAPGQEQGSVAATCHFPGESAGPPSSMSVLGAPGKAAGPTLTSTKNSEWVEKQLEWRMNIEMKNRSAKKAYEQDSIRFVSDVAMICVRFNAVLFTN